MPSSTLTYTHTRLTSPTQRIYNLSLAQCGILILLRELHVKSSHHSKEKLLSL